MEIPILLIVFSSMLFALKLVLDYRRERWQLKSPEKASGSSLGMSELRRLLGEAVEDAVDPVVARLGALETAVRSLKASEPPKALPEPAASSAEVEETEPAEERD